MPENPFPPTKERPAFSSPVRTQLLLDGSSSVLPFLSPLSSQSPQMLVGQESYKSSEGGNWIPTRGTTRNHLQSQLSVRKRIRDLSKPISASITSPNLLLKRHGNRHRETLAHTTLPCPLSKTPRGASRKTWQKLSTEEVGGVRRKGPPCDRAGHESGNISPWGKLTRHRASTWALQSHRNVASRANRMKNPTFNIQDNRPGREFVNSI